MEKPMENLYFVYIYKYYSSVGKTDGKILNIGLKDVGSEVPD
jgi:hypothetical protein